MLFVYGIRRDEQESDELASQAQAQAGVDQKLTFKTPDKAVKRTKALPKQTKAKVEDIPYAGLMYGCKKGDVSNCLRCNKKHGQDYSLMPTCNHANADTNGCSWYELDTGMHKINITLPFYDPLRAAGEVGSANCFGFATHQYDPKCPDPMPGMTKKKVGQKGKVAGSSPLSKSQNINQKGMDEAMEKDGAIFLGRTADDFAALKDKELPIKKGQWYYIVMVVMQVGSEYHFWGLWNDGWRCTPSLISATVKSHLEIKRTVNKLCPSSQSWNAVRMHESAIKYDDDKGGIYLYPCKGEGKGRSKCVKTSR